MNPLKYVAIALFTIMVLSSGYKRPERYIIDAVKNASRHNTMGVDYLQERAYYGAIQEFKIAISLNPNTQASAVYYNNLGETYMIIGYPMLALDCFDRAIKLNGLNLKFYQSLASCYNKMGTTQSMISKYKVSKNPLDKVMLGLLYIDLGDTEKGIFILDEFIMSEPDLLITPSVSQYLKEVLDNKLD